MHYIFADSTTKGGYNDPCVFRWPCQAFCMKHQGRGGTQSSLEKWFARPDNCTVTLATVVFASLVCVQSITQIIDPT